MSIYREMVKLTHPDVNQVDSLEKIKEVNKFKNSPHILIKLAKKWGLNIDFSKYKNIEEESERIYNDIIGCIVLYFVSKGRGKSVLSKGVIVSKTTFKSGKYAGQPKFVVFDRISGKYKHIKSYSSIVGKLSSEDTIAFLDSYENYLNRKKEKKKNQKDYDKDHSHNLFKKFGLVQKKDYSKDGIRVRVIINSNIYISPLIKTTNEFVYIPWLKNKSGLKRIHIKNVMEVII